jgi:colicin import membrane protein
MSDEPAKDGATPPGTTTTSGATPEQTSLDAMSTSDDDKGKSDELRDAGVRALTAEREARQAAERRAAESERRIAELEDAGKSETERERNRADREQKRADEAEARIARLEYGETQRRIAIEVGLPIELAERLQGDDDRALRADAKRLLDLTQPPDGRLGAGRGGVTPARGAEDMNTLIRRAAGRE